MITARSDRNFRINKPFKVLVCLVTLVVFFINILSYDLISLRSKAWAAENALGFPGGGLDSVSGPGSFNELCVDTFTLPEYLGHVKDSWSASERITSYERRTTKSPVIIHVQDAHCNYYAQHKISQIIEYLNSKYGVNTINLEGGAREYDLSVFTDISNKALREKTVDYFVKEGLVNGAEYYAVNNPGKVNLWGIEDTDLYISNLKVYRNSLKHKEEIEDHLKTLSYALSLLKTNIFSKELLGFDMKYGAYKANNMEFKDYLASIIEIAGSKAIGIKALPNIYLLNQTLKTETEIDFRQADTERDELIEAIRRRLSKNDLEELVNRVVEFRSEKISQDEFYAYLINIAREKEIELAAFPELQKYIVYISMYGAIDKSKAIEEIDKLEDEIRASLCRSDDEIRLCRLSKNLSLLKNLFGISLTRSDYSYYKANEESFNVSNFTAFIHNVAPKHDLEVRLTENIGDLDRYRSEIERFYEYSLKRDDAFIKNIRFTNYDLRVTNNASRASVLITGGFHSENLADLFKQRGISYVSIMPNFRNCDGYECPYFSILSNGNNCDIKDAVDLALNRSLAIPDPLNPAIVSAVSAIDHDIGAKTISDQDDATLAAGKYRKPLHGDVHEAIVEGLPADLKGFKDMTPEDQGRALGKYRDPDGQVVIPIGMLVRRTGLLGHIGLGQFYEEPVVYIDSYFNERGAEGLRKRVKAHEQYEIKKWTEHKEIIEKDVFEHPITHEEMRQWIRYNSNTEGTGPAQILAEQWHGRAPPVDDIYKTDMYVRMNVSWYRLRRAFGSLRQAMVENQEDWNKLSGEITGRPLDATKQFSLEIVDRYDAFSAINSSGKITFLLDYCEVLNDDELAWMLGHEMVHGYIDSKYYQGGPSNWWHNQRTILTRIGDLIWEYLSPQEMAAWDDLYEGEIIKRAIPILRAHKHRIIYELEAASQKEEHDADKLSIFLIRHAKLDPAAAVSAYEKTLNAVSNMLKQGRVTPTKEIDHYSSHPSEEDRLKVIGEFAQRYNEEAATDVYAEEDDVLLAAELTDSRLSAGARKNIIDANKDSETTPDRQGTLKVPGSYLMDEDEGIDKDYIKSLTSQAHSESAHDVAYDMHLPRNINEMLKRGGVDLSKVEFRIIYGVDSLGIPKYRGANRLSEQIPALGEWSPGRLIIYTTHSFYNLLKKDAALFAEVVDHEWQEQMKEYPHARAARLGRRWVGVGKIEKPFGSHGIDLLGNKLSPYHKFILDKLYEGQEEDHLRTLLLERRDSTGDAAKYEDNFKLYISMLLCKPAKGEMSCSLDGKTVFFKDQSSMPGSSAYSIDSLTIYILLSKLLARIESSSSLEPETKVRMAAFVNMLINDKNISIDTLSVSSAGKGFPICSFLWKGKDAFSSPKISLSVPLSADNDLYGGQRMLSFVFSSAIIGMAGLSHRHEDIISSLYSPGELNQIYENIKLYTKNLTLLNNALPEAVQVSNYSKVSEILAEPFDKFETEDPAVAGIMEKHLLDQKIAFIETDSDDTRFADMGDRQKTEHIIDIATTLRYDPATNTFIMSKLLHDSNRAFISSREGIATLLGLIDPENPSINRVFGTNRSSKSRQQRLGIYERIDIIKNGLALLGAVEGFDLAWLSGHIKYDMIKELYEKGMNDAGYVKKWADAFNMYKESGLLFEFEDLLKLFLEDNDPDKVIEIIKKCDNVVYSFSSDLKYPALFGVQDSAEERFKDITKDILTHSARSHHLAEIAPSMIFALLAEARAQDMLEQYLNIAFSMVEEMRENDLAAYTVASFIVSFALLISSAEDDIKRQEGRGLTGLLKEHLGIDGPEGTAEETVSATFPLFTDVAKKGDLYIRALRLMRAGGLNDDIVRVSGKNGPDIVMYLSSILGMQINAAGRGWLCRISPVVTKEGLGGYKACTGFMALPVIKRIMKGVTKIPPELFLRDSAREICISFGSKDSNATLAYYCGEGTGNIEFIAQHDFGRMIRDNMEAPNIFAHELGHHVDRTQLGEDERKIFLGLCGFCFYHGNLGGMVRLKYRKEYDQFVWERREEGTFDWERETYRIDEIDLKELSITNIVYDPITKVYFRVNKREESTDQIKSEKKRVLEEIERSKGTTNIVNISYRQAYNYLGYMAYDVLNSQEAVATHFEAVISGNIWNNSLPRRSDMRKKWWDEHAPAGEEYPAEADIMDRWSVEWMHGRFFTFLRADGDYDEYSYISGVQSRVQIPPALYETSIHRRLERELGIEPGVREVHPSKDEFARRLVMSKGVGIEGQDIMDSDEGSSGLIGKLYTSSILRNDETLAKNVTVTRVGNTLTFTQNGGPLYDKKGRLVKKIKCSRKPVDLSEISLDIISIDHLADGTVDKEIAGMILSVFKDKKIFLLKRNRHGIRGAPDQDGNIYLSRKLIREARKNPERLFHEIGESFKERIEETIAIDNGVRINAHTFLRGCGKNIRNNEKIDWSEKDIEKLIENIRGVLSTGRANEDEFNLIRYNSAQGYSGRDLMMGLQDKAFGVKAELMKRQSTYAKIEHSLTSPISITDLLPILQASELDQVALVRGMSEHVKGADEKKIDAMLAAIETLPSEQRREAEMTLRAALETEAIKFVAPKELNVVVQYVDDGQGNGSFTATQNNDAITATREIARYLGKPGGRNNEVASLPIIGAIDRAGGLEDMARIKLTINNAIKAMDDSENKDDARTLFEVPTWMEKRFIDACRGMNLLKNHVLGQSIELTDSRIKVQLISQDGEPDVRTQFKFGIAVLDWVRRGDGANPAADMALLNLISFMIDGSQDPADVLNSLFKQALRIRKVDWHTMDESRKAYEALATAL